MHTDTHLNYHKCLAEMTTGGGGVGQSDSGQNDLRLLGIIDPPHEKGLTTQTEITQILMA